jgi:hypothetical protein
MALGGGISCGKDDAVGLLRGRTSGESRYLKSDTLLASQANDKNHEHMVYGCSILLFIEVSRIA